MASQLVNELDCIKHCWSVYEQNSIVNSVSVDDWTVECAIIASYVNNTHQATKSIFYPILFFDSFL